VIQTFEEYLIKLNALQDLSDKLNIEMRKLYSDNVFLTWRWWLCFALTIIPWVLWIIFRKKGSSARLLFAGFLTVIISMYLDDIGVELNFWDYNVDFDAIDPSFILWDMTVLPVTTMFLLQVKPRIHPVFKAIALATLAAFIVEPFFAWMNYYDTEKWRFIYSFPIYIVIYLLAYLCSRAKTFEPL
jgi:hypothetical protein